MTHEQFLEWLDKEIAACKKEIRNRSVPADAFGYLLGKKDTFVAVKKIYESTLTPPSTTLS